MRPRRPAGTWVPHWRKPKPKYLLIPIPPNGFPLIAYGQCRMALPVSACQKSPKNTLLFRTSRIQQCGNSLQVSGRFWRSAKPTLCKGGWHGAAVTGGLYVFKRIPFLPQYVNPSVKNQRFLPAPFTQGSRGAPAPVHLSMFLKRSRKLHHILHWFAMIWAVRWFYKIPKKAPPGSSIPGAYTIYAHQKLCWVPRMKLRVFSLLGWSKTSSGVPISSITPSAM